jgi:mannose-6-phosphate isomerase class I
VPVPDFELAGVDLDGYRKPGQDAGECAAKDEGKPYLVLCVSGGVRVTVEGDSTDLAPGQAAFVRSRGPLFLLRGTGRAFLATVRSRMEI